MITEWVGALIEVCGAEDNTRDFLCYLDCVGFYLDLAEYFLEHKPHSLDC